MKLNLFSLIAPPDPTWHKTTPDLSPSLRDCPSFSYRVYLTVNIFFFSSSFELLLINFMQSHISDPTLPWITSKDVGVVFWLSFVAILTNLSSCLFVLIFQSWRFLNSKETIIQVYKFKAFSHHRRVISQVSLCNLITRQSTQEGKEDILDFE